MHWKMIYSVCVPFRVAFGTYLLSILLFIFVIRYGAWFMLITGLLMVLACFAFGIIMINDPPLAVPFANPIQGEVFVRPTYGWSFILTIVTGNVVWFLALVILLMDYFMPRRIAVVFHHSIVEEDEFFQVSCMAEDLGVAKRAVLNKITLFLIQVEEEEEVGEKPLDEYGVSARVTRGRTSRGRTTRRGLSRYRQTQRKPRSTVRTTRGSHRLEDDVIQLQEIPKES